MKDQGREDEGGKMPKRIMSVRGWNEKQTLSARRIEIVLRPRERSDRSSFIFCPLVRRY